MATQLKLQNDAAAGSIEVSDATFGARIQRSAGAPGRHCLHGGRPRRHQGARRRKAEVRGGGQQAVEPEGRRSRPCRLHPQPDLGRRWPRLRGEAARLHAEGQPQDVPRRDQRDAVRAGPPGSPDGRRVARARRAEDQAARARSSRSWTSANVLIVIEALRREARAGRAQPAVVAVLPVSAVDPVSLIRHERVLATVGAVRMIEERLA